MRETPACLSRSLKCALALFLDHDRDLREELLDASRMTACTGMEALHHHAFADARFPDDEVIDIEVVIVFRVGDRRLQNLLDRSRNALGRERQLVQSPLRGKAANGLRDEIELARADADHPADCFGLVVRENAPESFLAHHSTLFAFRSPPAEWP
jgi:hypothetical protein